MDCEACPEPRLAPENQVAWDLINELTYFITRPIWQTWPKKNQICYQMRPASIAMADFNAVCDLHEIPAQDRYDIYLNLLDYLGLMGAAFVEMNSIN